MEIAVVTREYSRTTLDLHYRNLLHDRNLHYANLLQKSTTQIHYMTSITEIYYRNLYYVNLLQKSITEIYMSLREKLTEDERFKVFQRLSFEKFLKSLTTSLAIPKITIGRSCNIKTKFLALYKVLKSQSDIDRIRWKDAQICFTKDHKVIFENVQSIYIMDSDSAYRISMKGRIVEYVDLELWNYPEESYTCYSLKQFYMSYTSFVKSIDFHLLKTSRFKYKFASQPLIEVIHLSFA